MNNYQSKLIWRTVLLIFFYCNLLNPIVAQKKDSLKVHAPLKATANVNINSKGISLFPNLTYGKPAVILTGSVGKNNIYFEPELRWGLTGKPWSYIFWFRYKYKKSEHFGFNVGAHPSYVVRKDSININGKNELRYIAQRYFAGEIVPTYYFSKKFALGIQYLYSKGLDPYAIQNSHFLSFQPKFPDINVSKNYYLSFYPQLFHLILDAKEGTYASESLFLNWKNHPLSISSIFTYKIKSTIAGNNIVWNIGLNYKL